MCYCAAAKPNRLNWAQVHCNQPLSILYYLNPCLMSIEKFKVQILGTLELFISPL